MEERNNEDEHGAPELSPPSAVSSRKTSKSLSAKGLVMEVTIARTRQGFSRRQWILLIFFGVIDFLSAMTISLQAPFYPSEAERKGSTALEYGLVFGIFEFMVFLMSPIFGKYMNKIGVKAVFNMSVLVTSIAVLSFGLLHWVDDHTWFITLCFICRIFEGVGCAGFFTSTFVIIACEFPQTVATTFASLETFIGLGLIVGPTVGGALYSVGGFPLPFIVIGGCLLTTGLSAVFFMPATDKDRTGDGLEEDGYGIFTILKIPSVALAALSIVSTEMSYGYISATLEPHIRRFGLSPFQTGLVFIAIGGVYTVTAPFWGYLCDNIKKPVYVSVLGNFLVCASFLLIGPASFIPFDTILWVTIVGLVIQGLGLGCCFVSTFIVGLRDCMEYGLPDNISTYAVISGLVQTMISIGNCIGPSVGGFLYDTVGFRNGSWLILIISFVTGTVVLIHTCMSSSPSSSMDEEFQPLLESEVKVAEQKSKEKASKLAISSYGSTSRS